MPTVSACVHACRHVMPPCPGAVLPFKAGTARYYRLHEGLSNGRPHTLCRRSRRAAQTLQGRLRARLHLLGIERAQLRRFEDDDDLEGMQGVDDFWVTAPVDFDLMMRPDLEGAGFEEFVEEEEDSHFANSDRAEGGWMRPQGVASAFADAAGVLQARKDALTQRIVELGSRIKTLRSQGVDRYVSRRAMQGTLSLNFLKVSYGAQAWQDCRSSVSCGFCEIQTLH